MENEKTLLCSVVQIHHSENKGYVYVVIGQGLYTYAIYGSKASPSYIFQKYSTGPKFRDRVQVVGVS
jgi:hypothetical protein